MPPGEPNAGPEGPDRGPAGADAGEVDRRAADRRAADDGARLAAIVEGAGDIIVGTDLGAIVRSWNPAAQRILGWAPAEILGRPIDTYIAPESLPLAHELRRRLLQGGESSAAAELTYVARDGTTLPVWVVIAPIRGPGGEVMGVSAIGHDLRARKRLEAQLAEAQKLEAVGRLAGGIAHDFNNLLTAITGYATLVLEQLPPGSGAAADVAQILDATARAADLTRSLLALSRGKPREPRLVGLDQLVAGAEPVLRRLLPSRVRLRIEASSGLRLVADPTELELVLVHLAVRAADAMPDGGELTIQTRAVDLDAAFAETHLGVVPGRHGELAVHDTGPGLSDDERAHLFDPFYAAGPERGRAGLGLTMVHAYVEQARGTTWVESEPGRGTTFRILLPVPEHGTR